MANLRIGTVRLKAVPGLDGECLCGQFQCHASKMRHTDCEISCLFNAVRLEPPTRQVYGRGQINPYLCFLASRPILISGSIKSPSVA